MFGQSNKSNNATDDGIPIQNSGVLADTPVGPKRQKEITIRMKRDAAHDVRQRRSVKNCQYRAREKEQSVEEYSPQPHVDLHAQLDTGSAHDQQPENDH